MTSRRRGRKVQPGSYNLRQSSCGEKKGEHFCRSESTSAGEAVELVGGMLEGGVQPR